MRNDINNGGLSWFKECYVYAAINRTAIHHTIEAAFFSEFTKILTRNVVKRR